MSPLRPPVSEADHRAGSDEAAVTLVEYGDNGVRHDAPWDVETLVEALQTASDWSEKAVVGGGSR